MLSIEVARSREFDPPIERSDAWFLSTSTGIFSLRARERASFGLTLFSSSRMATILKEPLIDSDSYDKRNIAQ